MNTLITPGSGNISFSNFVAAGSNYLPPLSASARIAYTRDGGLTIVSTASSSERFNVEGNFGSLLTVNDSATGRLFNVNDISGFPLFFVTDNGTVSSTGVVHALGGNSNQWNAAYTNLVNNSGAYLSGFNAFDASAIAAASGSWNSNYTTTKDNSASWSQAYTNLVTNSANYLSGASTSYVNANFVKLSGDTMTGPLSTPKIILTTGGSSSNPAIILSGTNFNSGIYLTGNGDGISINTRNNYTNLSITSQGVFSDRVIGTTADGSAAFPSVYVGYETNSGLFRPAANNIAISIAGTERIRVNSSGLTVTGNISANGTITASGGNSTQWNAAYTNLVSNSSAYLSGANLSSIATASGAWNSNYTSFNANSSFYDAAVNELFTYVITESGDEFITEDSLLMVDSNIAGYPAWNSTTDTVIGLSAGWQNAANAVASNASNWTSTYTTTQVNTAADSFDLSYTGTLPVPRLPVYTVNPLRDALLGASGSQAATLRNGKWVSAININGYGTFTLDDLISLSSADIVGIRDSFFVSNTTKLTTINFPSLVTVGANFSISSALSQLTTINFPSLVSIGSFMQMNGTLNSLTTLSFPSLVSVGTVNNVIVSSSLTAMNFPSLVTIAGSVTVFSIANSLPSITFPSLVTVGGSFTIASFSGSANSLTSISFPSLSAITGSFALSNGGNMNAVTSVSFPSLAIVGTNIQQAFGTMNSLTTLSFPSLVSVGGGISVTGSTLRELTTLLIGPSLQHVNSDITITAGRLDGHNAWSANTYYASYASFTAPASAFSSTPTGTTCTVNIMNHGLQTGDIIGVHGITGSSAAVHIFNGQGVLVTRITANQFTYSITATTQLPTGTATIQVQAATVAPVTKNGRKYICTGAGTSGGTEPAWPTTIGSTVADGTATWTCSEMSLSNILTRLDALNGTNQTITYGANRVVGLGPPSSLVTVNSISTTAGVATITTSSNHGITTGTQVVISGCTGTALRYNGVWTVTSTGLTTLTTPVPTDLNGVAGAGTMRLTTSCPQFTGNTPISATTITGGSADSHMIATVNNIQLRDSDSGSSLPIFPAGIYNRNGTTNGFARYSCTENGWDIWYDTITKRWVNSPSQFTGVTAAIGNYLFTAQSVPLASTSSANPAVITSSASHGIATGAVFTVVIEGCSNAALNGSWTATSTGATTFTIPVDGSAGATTSSGTVAVLNQSFNQGRLMTGSISAPIQGVQQTITTSVNHGFTTGDFIHFYGAVGTHAASVNDLVTSSTTKSMASAITVINATSFTCVRYATTQPFVGSYTLTTMPHMRDPSMYDTAYYLALKMRSRGVAVSLAGTTGI